MEYEEYKALSKEPATREEYEAKIEPYYMQLNLDKKEFCKFIETKEGEQALYVFTIQRGAIDMLNKENGHLMRYKDIHEKNRCLAILDFLKDHSDTDNEIKSILNEKIRYYTRRIEK